MTTKYYTVNGMLLYESTAGVRTEYVHDALGSVIATTDANRNVQNTYRWAGYGTLIAKTGTAADPASLWNGTSGYRAMGRSHAETYVRRRHYDLVPGSWNTADPIRGIGADYGYCDADPTGRADPTGLISVKMLCQPLNTTDCGGASTSYKWVLDIKEDRKACGGKGATCYLVQKVTMKLDTYCCDPLKKIPISCVDANSTYWEAWKVKYPDSDGPPTIDSMVQQNPDCVPGYVNCDDTFKMTPAGPFTISEGFLGANARRIRGEAKIVGMDYLTEVGGPGVPGVSGDPNNTWRQDHPSCGPGCLWYTTSFGNWDNIPPKKAFCHQLSVRHRCCCRHDVAQTDPSCFTKTSAWNSLC